MLDIVKIYANDLEQGMYISSLDRPWLETPFTLQGFRLQSDEEIRRLQEYCQYVYVDTSKSIQEAAIVRRKVRNLPRRSRQELFPTRALKDYPDDTRWDEEYPEARKAVMILSKGISTIYQKMADTATLDMVTVKTCIEPMVDSLVRHPGACVWLVRLMQEGYPHRHALCCSIWAVAMGRQLGLPKTDLRTLAIGGLLFDVGKLGVDQELLQTSRPLTDEEFQQVRNHVKLGVEMIQGSALMNTDVIDMITYHHERYNGSGYPEGRSGDDIPIFARIAAIVDCYDAITSHRPYARALPPSTAIKKLYEWKDIDFEGELVDEFIQAVGVYPAGTIVELSSGEVAVVMAGTRNRRLRPRVLMMLDADKQPLPEPLRMDLLKVTTTTDGKPLDIRSSLEPNAHGIDMSAIPI